MLLLLLFSRPVGLFATPWTATHQATLSLTISWNLPKFMSIALVMPCSHLIFWHPLLLLPSIFSASGTLPMSQLFPSDDQNTGVSASALIFPMSIQGWFPLQLPGLISLLSSGLSGVFSSTTVWRHQFFSILPSFPSSPHNRYMNTGKTIALTILTFVGRVMSLLFNTLSRFVIAFLPRSKCLLLSWLHSSSAEIFRA